MRKETGQCGGQQEEVGKSFCGDQEGEKRVGGWNSDLVKTWIRS